jgi:NitT/TauT family transport system substrate-binding protein
MVAALELGQIDVAPVTEPLWSKEKDQFRVLISGSDALPPLDNVVGVATAQAVATRGDFVAAVIRVRRRAIQFMHEHPEEAGAIIAKRLPVSAFHQCEAKSNSVPALVSARIATEAS